MPLIEDELKRSKEDFLVEHFAKYDNPPYPPAWKTLEVSSFGTLSKLYCNLSDNNLKNNFKQKLKALLSEYSIVDVAAMGFPKSWHNEPLWK